MAEMELEQQLLEVGNRLLNPPSSVDELLPLLDQVESFLSRVEQSPSKSMQNALCPCMKALVADELLRHFDMDVKVAVTSCISEITRITAPDAPYNDEQMKEFFQLIIAAFEKLYDMSCQSYSKRVSILVTMAKVQSCVVMLDLECDALILEMFQHFLSAIRDNHSDNVFSSMETIMSLVLEESEDISLELLTSLLACVKKENQDILPIARKLGEKVIEKCAAKLKPYVMQAVQSKHISLNDYNEVVGSICQATSDIERNEANASAEKLTDVSKTSEIIAPDEPHQVTKLISPEAALPRVIDPLVEKPLKSIMSNGTTVQTENDDSLIDSNSPRKKLQRSRRKNQSKGTDAVAKAETDNLGIVKEVQIETKPVQAPKKTRGRKPDANNHALTESKKETAEMPDCSKNVGKEADSSNSGDTSNKAAAVLLEHEKATRTRISLPTASQNETVDVTSPAPSRSLLDETRPKRGQRGTQKKGNKNQEADPGSKSPPGGTLLSDHIEAEGKESEGMHDSKAKLNRRSGKKALASSSITDKTPDVDVSKKDSRASSDLKATKQSGKKEDANAIYEESSIKQQEDKRKRGRRTNSLQKDSSEEAFDKKMVSSPKSMPKSSNKDESPKTKSKRKGTPGETSGTPHIVKEFGENLVNSTIKVWWPDDQMFYEGVIDSFDPINKTHKVLYVDGDEEILSLKNEKWEFTGCETEADVQEQPIDHPKADGPSDMPKKKKAKTNSDSSSKKEMSSTLERDGETSTNKSKNEAKRSGSKSKDDSSKSMDAIASPKIVSKPKEHSDGKSKKDTPKTGSKSKKGAPKSSAKPKDEEPETSVKSDDDTPKNSVKSKGDALKTKPSTSTKSKNTTQKIGTKSKGETPKTGSNNDTPTKGKSSKSPANDDPAKAKGSVGKKRRRNTNS